MNKKKNNKLIEKQFKGESLEATRIIKIFVGVVLAFVLIYFVTAIITGEIKLKEETEEATIQTEEILAEQTFKQSDSTYYVLYYDFEGKEKDIIEAIYGKISQLNSIYKVDLSHINNKNYLVDEQTIVKTAPTKISELKVKNPTLIKISNKRVVKFLTGVNAIKEYSIKLK